MYDDINSIDRMDFAEVGGLFNTLDAIATDDDWFCLDIDGNGRIDFADVVWPFNRL